jgi:TrmH family RNA methyltransferase
MVPQGIIGVCEITNNSNIGEKVLLLDNVQDPGNIGTLIRSCVAFGFSTIISENSVDYYNEKVVRSTQGALFKVNLLNGSLSDFIKESKDYDFYVTDLKSDFTLEETEFKNNKLGIILGNEGQGVRQELIDLVDQSFKIKMKNMESLNVGVAGSIIMYEIFKRSKR